MVAAGRTDPVANIYSAGSSYKSALKGKARMEPGEKLYERISK